MAQSLNLRVAISLLFVAVSSLSALAQPPAPNTTEWESEALKLRLFYPSDLVKTDTDQVMRDDRLTLAGVTGATSPKLVEGTHCLRPALVLQLPQSNSPQTTKTQPTAEGDTQITVTPGATATL